MAFRAIILVLALFTTGLANAQLTGSLRVRGEHWTWFETPGFDDEYRFLGVLLRAGVAHRFTKTLEGQVEAAVPLLAGLPDNAVAPAPRGQLGFGGSYFAANPDSTVITAFVKQAWLRASFGKASLRFGRFELIDGTEVVPKNAMLAEVKRTRIAHRLLGNFGFTHVGRSVDGAQLVWQIAPESNVVAVAARPTAGAFEANANSTLDVGLLYFAASRATQASDARLFLIAYGDRRENVIKTDNRGLAERRADQQRVEIGTFGGHYVRLFPLGGGTADVLLWGAVQGGEWGALDHQAAAADIEAGWRRGNFAIRAGTHRSSGDDDPGDGDHETFFQILPTPRSHARFPFYNGMNSRDGFLIASWKATPKLTMQSELHRLRVTSENDLWYSGGGAFDDQSFGFAGRPTNGHSDLANVIDLSADYTINAKTSVTAYLSAAKGGAIVRSIFAGRRGSLAYIEITRRF